MTLMFSIFRAIRIAFRITKVVTMTIGIMHALRRYSL